MKIILMHNVTLDLNKMKSLKTTTQSGPSLERVPRVPGTRPERGS